MRHHGKQDRVITEFEESKEVDKKSFITKINSSDFSNMTKKTVFIISLTTATVVNLLMNILL